jgi:hypothetical protein
LGRVAKGVSALIPGLVVTALLMMVTVLLVAGVLDSVKTAVELNQWRTPRYTMRITWANFTDAYGGPSIELRLVNEGSEALYRLEALEAIVSYESSGSRAVEILRFKGKTGSWTPGYWSVLSIDVGSVKLDPESHPYLRPGEEALIVAYMQRWPDAGTLITVTIISPEAVKAEFSLVR